MKYNFKLPLQKVIVVMLVFAALAYTIIGIVNDNLWNAYLGGFICLSLAYITEHSNNGDKN